jgi:beta-lactamase class A
MAGRVRGSFGLAVVDLTNGETFLINEEKVFPQASAIKIPLLMEVYKQEREGKFKFTDIRRVKKTEHTAGSGILRELGDATVEMNLHDLCVLMILVSDNTATNMLIDLVGMERVNQTMQGLGLTQTRLRRRMMDLDAITRGNENVSTPAEAARIMQLLYRGEFISREVCDGILAILTKAKTSAVAAGLPAGTPVASKPGGINGVVTEWAIVLLDGRPYIMIAMETYNPPEEASTTIKEISAELYRYFKRLPAAWVVADKALGARTRHDIPKK